MLPSYFYASVCVLVCVFGLLRSIRVSVSGIDGMLFIRIPAASLSVATALERKISFPLQLLIAHGPSGGIELRGLPSVTLFLERQEPSSINSRMETKTDQSMDTKF